MKLRPLLLIVAIILLPIIALSWAAARISSNERVVMRERFRDLLTDRLQDVNGRIESYFSEVERELSQLAEIDEFDTDSLRAINRREPKLLQLFVLAPQGKLIYPDPEGPINSSERLFLIQAAQMFTGQDLQDAVLRAEPSGGNRPTKIDVSASQLTNTLPIEPELPNVEDSVRNAYQSSSLQPIEQFDQTSGWLIWYWDRGLNLIYWQRRPSGHIVGLALERARWMSDLVAVLPTTIETESSQTASMIETRIGLVNASNEIVYQWGSYSPDENDRPFCEISVVEPAAAWRLQCFVSESQLIAGTGQATKYGIVTGLVGVVAALLLSSVLLLRDYAKDMREAALQVTFVNQVSHELKTPLTNIQMYAELLERDLSHGEVASDSERQRLDVILSESQRLGRLIGNVLTFARGKRKTLQLCKTEVVPDEVINRILSRFSPMFERLDIAVHTELGAGAAMSLDCDALEQILDNLLSNVEKYAASGNRIEIHTFAQDNELRLLLRDYGPGVPKRYRARIFKPFVRVSNDVSYAAGTGIGLSIARDLARMHGGDVVLLDSESGCLFQVTLRSGRMSDDATRSSDSRS